MEDMINALLDVVRAQHSAAEGTDETPFNMDDIVDMAMNLMGRPDEQEEVDAMVDEIQKTVSSLAPDIFPPKTFEEMDDSEKAASAANMIESAFLRNNNNTAANPAPDNPAPEIPQNNYPSYDSYQEEEEETETQNAGDLNDLIYKNFMEMMGLSSPQVEFPFDRSQIVYGKEKSVTEQLAEEEEEKERLAREEAERNRKLSAWELAQNAIDTDEAAHAKEPYEPKPVEQPQTKSASQMAAEAIRRSEEEDRMKLEIEKQAEAMMAEAQRRGQDPMKFMLHQQEILRYMEDNSDELVSFEDYEDLSPEEKLEIERKIHIEKQLEEGVDPSEVDENVPEEYIPEELKAQPAPAQETMEESETTFDEDTLRALSAQVLSENSAMFDGETSGDMENFQEELFENLKRMMAGSGTSIPMEDIGSLLAQATSNAMGGQEEAEESQSPAETSQEERPEEKPEESPREESSHPMSAVELAMAAQKAMKPEPAEEERQTVSAADLAKAAQEKAKKTTPPEDAEDAEEVEEKEELDMSFDELDDLFDEDSAKDEEVEERPVETEITEAAEEESNDADSVQETPEEAEAEEIQNEEAEEDDEYEYVDPDELVLGEHTQAEVDEALENLSSLGLEGEVLERAKHMILLELAGSEAALDAYLFEQENSKKKKKANVSDLDKEDIDDLTDFDEDLFEEELAMAMEEDFAKEEAEPEETEEEEIIVEKAVKEEEKEEGKTSRKTKTPHRPSKGRKSVVHKSERNHSDSAKEDFHSEENETVKDVEERGYQLSVHKPFVLKNSTSFMEKFESFITESQENRKLSTGFKKLDAMLRFGLHKGSYFIDAQPQYLKNGFMQQIADRAAESGVDVLYISTELSRYDLMVDSISRLSYEMNHQDPEKAHSVMEILTGENGATLESLKDELNWYRGRISEHLFILDQEAVDDFIDSMEEEVSASAILEELIRSIVREGAHKPVVFIDNIENILSADDSEDMKPLMDGISRLAKELSIPIVMSYGYMQVENEEDLTEEEVEFHRSLGNMCDVYLELEYADMVTEDSMELTPEDIREMEEDGDRLLIDILIHRNRRPMRASCQIEGTPKFNYFVSV